MRCTRCDARWRIITDGNGQVVMTCGSCGAREVVRSRPASLSDELSTHGTGTPCVIFSVHYVLTVAEKIRQGRRTLDEMGVRMGFSRGPQVLRFALMKVLGDEGYAEMMAEARSRRSVRSARKRG